MKSKAGNRVEPTPTDAHIQQIVDEMQSGEGALGKPQGVRAGWLRGNAEQRDGAGSDG